MGTKTIKRKELSGIFRNSVKLVVTLMKHNIPKFQYSELCVGLLFLKKIGYVNSRNNQSPFTWVYKIICIVCNVVM